MTLNYVGIKLVTAWPSSKDGQEGYAVKYDDGYISWSPKATFETAYIPIHNDYSVSLNITTQDHKTPVNTNS